MKFFVVVTYQPDTNHPERSFIVQSFAEIDADLAKPNSPPLSAIESVIVTSLTE